VTAFNVPKFGLLESNSLEAIDRTVKVLGLAESTYSGELERNSDGKYASIVSWPFSFPVVLLLADYNSRMIRLDVILRAEIVERAKAGDKVIFTGTFIVVPDVAALGLPGVNAEMLKENAGGRSGPGSMGGNLGVSGLKSLGVKDLTYKTAFLACMATSAEARVSPALISRPR
jgi:hypothetical protein